MISLGNSCRNIRCRDGATAVLTEHATYTWNKTGTRIRCNGDSCGVVLEAPDGPEGITAAPAFALHQVEQLPDPFDPDVEPEAPAAPDTIEPQATEEPVAGLISETEPSGEPMETVTLEPATAPAEPVITALKVRRDTKALTATIAELEKGDRVAAGFSHPRYGQFTVTGTVIKGCTGLDRNQLVVCGWYINLNERAAKHLQELVIVAPAGQHEFEIPKPSESTD